MFKRTLLIALLSATPLVSAIAEDNKGAATSDSRQKRAPVSAISPIFAQLVKFSYPNGFKVVSEKTKGIQYIRESVLEGETVDNWTQMISVTGAKGLAAKPNATPQKLVELVTGGFKQACADTFSVKGLGSLKIDGADAFVALVGCGTIQTSKSQHGETALVIAIKGSEDYYTIQWAERQEAARQPLELNESKWFDRFKELAPIKLCAAVPGEPAPYPSCAS
jgi:hypothetical protein